MKAMTPDKAKKVSEAAKASASAVSDARKQAREKIKDARKEARRQKTRARIAAARARAQTRVKTSGRSSKAVGAAGAAGLAARCLPYPDSGQRRRHVARDRALSPIRRGAPPTKRHADYR